MTNLLTTIDLHKALLDEGYRLPDDTVCAELRMHANDVVQLRFTVNVTDETAEKLARALTNMAMKNRRRRA